MDIKVREVSADEKSTQQIEQELLDKHEEKQQSETENESIEVKAVEPEAEVEVKEENTQEESPVEEVVEEQPPQLEAQPELNEDEVLSYIGKRYGKEINSIDELVSKREESEPLPEDVAAYLKYKKETGRGFEDYAKLQKDFSDLSPDALLREYYTITEEGLDSEDIDSLMEDYVYDEELDDESVIKKTKLAKKKTIAKAKKYFNEQKEMYKQPLESSPVATSESENEEFQAYKQYIESVKTQQEESDAKRSWFIKKTDEVFTEDFKGFEFSLGDNTVTYSPGDTQSIKKNQETPMNFINKYLDEDGLMKDAGGYHRALAIAMNPDKFANFFYEQGKSEATEDVLRKTKNINMSERRAPEVTNKGGFQVKSVNPDSGRGLKIRSINKK